MSQLTSELYFEDNNTPDTNANLDGVVCVPTPVVFGHVAEGGVDATLRCHGVRARGEQLGDAGALQPGCEVSCVRC